MVVVNRTGVEPPLTFYGSSFISDPYGRILVQAPRHEPAVLVADLDLDQRRDWLGLFPFLTHAPAGHVRLADLGGLSPVPSSNASVVLAVVAVVASFVAILSWWAERNLFEADEFAARASVALDSAAVRPALAEEIADRLVSSGVASLSSFRTVLVPLIEDVEETDAFHQLFRASVADVHRAVFQRHASQALLELGDTLSILTATAKQTDSSVASRLPAEATSILVDVSPALKRHRAVAHRRAGGLARRRGVDRGRRRRHRLGRPRAPPAGGAAPTGHRCGGRGRRCRHRHRRHAGAGRPGRARRGSVGRHPVRRPRLHVGSAHLGAVAHPDRRDRGGRRDGDRRAPSRARRAVRTCAPSGRGSPDPGPGRRRSLGAGA